MTDTVYFLISTVTFIFICTVIQVLCMKDELEKMDVILATLLGVLVSLAWPASISVAIVVVISRFLAKTYLKYCGDSDGR